MLIYTLILKRYWINRQLFENWDWKKENEIRGEIVHYYILYSLDYIIVTRSKEAAVLTIQRLLASTSRRQSHSPSTHLYFRHTQLVYRSSLWFCCFINNIENTKLQTRDCIVCSVDGLPSFYITCGGRTEHPESPFLLLLYRLNIKLMNMERTSMLD